MKTLFVLAFSLVSLTSFAGTRGDTRGMSCSRAASLVNSMGAVVLTTGDGLYDRFVANGSFCATGETTQPAWVATRDSQACFVGYVCRTMDGGGGF